MHITRPAALLVAAATASLLAAPIAPAVAKPPPPAPYVYTVADFPSPADSDPDAIALDSEYDTLYVLDSHHRVDLIDSTTGVVQRSVPGIDGDFLTIDTAAHVAYAGSFGGALTAIARDGSTRSVDGMADGTNAIAADPTAHQVYGVDPDGKAVDVVAAAGGRVATIPVGDAPSDVAIDDVGRRAYVTNYRDDTVSVIDVDTQAVVDTVAVGAGPADVAVDVVSHRAYVTNAGDDTVSVVDGSTDRVIDTISVSGDVPLALAIDPVTHTAYGPTGWRRVMTIDLTSNTVTADVPTSASTWGVAVDLARHTALVMEAYTSKPLEQITQTVQRRAVITGLSATAGSTDGGEQVTITGDHFAGATKVLFGATPATDFTVTSDHQIVATVPPHAAGLVKVRVQTFGLSAKSRTSRYTYLAPSSPTA